MYDLLEEQWMGRSSPRMLQISGFGYTWDAARPVGGRIVEVRRDGAPIDRSATYTVAVNSFLAGGDNVTVLAGAKDRFIVPADLDAMIGYIQALPQPFSSSIRARIRREN